MTAVRRFAAALLLALPACGGVNHRLRNEIAQPATVAVLPFAGPANAPSRDATRALVQSRLAARGYRLVETNWVDRILSERGWLRDLATFDPSKVAVPEVIAALGVDAVVVGKGFDETSFNVLILRRHAFGGELAVQRADGVWWSANHSAGSYGGFLLTSGQVFSELRAQGDHGTPMQTLALVDEFVGDVVATIPTRQPGGPVPVPAVNDVTSKRTAMPDGSERLVVETRATPDCSVCVDLLPIARGVPMVALPGEPGRYRATQDVPKESKVTSIAVRARSAYGSEGKKEVTP